MLLQDIIKYKPRRGKPYKTESVTVGLKHARYAKTIARDYYIQAGITLVTGVMAAQLARMEKKKLEALRDSISRIKDNFTNRL